MPVNADNIHVALLFLGNIESDKEDLFKQALNSLIFPTLTLRFDKLEFWNKPRIICLTTTDTNPELLQLVASLSDIAKRLAIPIDERPYKPHVTLVKKATSLSPFS